MNSKLKKILAEIEKTKEKISQQQTKLRELERQKTELENTEIVELVRSNRMNTAELTAFLKAYREKDGAPLTIPKQEDTEHEEN